MLKSFLRVRVSLYKLFNHQTTNFKTMKIKKIFKTVLITLFVVTIFSCSDDDDTTFPQSSETIADFVAGNPNYSSLLAALQKAELVETLDGNGSFTVFAPNNAAFDAFLTGLGVTLDDLSKEDLTPILLNHVIGSEVTSAQLSTGYVSNLADVSTYVNTSNGVVLNGDVTVTTADIDQSNGVIHAVDKVIALPTLLTFAAADSDLSTLATVATTTQGFDTDFAAVLGGADSDLTLLAPDNDAFVALGDISGLTAAQVEQVLLNHVIAGTNLSSGLTTGYGSTLATYGDTSNNLNIYINTDGGVTFNGMSEVTTADIVASNGVIHKVGSVITLPTVVTFATADATFSTLVAALTRETDFTFVATLNTDNGTAPAPFTVFAPTNDAFGDLLTELSLADLAAIPTATLSATLSYHVVAEANVRSTDLTDGQVVTTLETGTFTVNTTSGVTITDENSRVTNVVVPDVQAANGVIHVVDQVLLPMM